MLCKSFCTADTHSAKIRVWDSKTVMSLIPKSNIDTKQCLLHGFKKTKQNKPCFFNNDFNFLKEISVLFFFPGILFPVLVKSIV